jgi:uncharacterized membrane protein YphA (DoxX/SURF4 family)
MSARARLSRLEKINLERDTQHLKRLLSTLRGERTYMTRKISYWATTGLLAAMSAFAAFSYLSGSPQAVQGFEHLGYPQQLRIILGIAKLLGAIVLVAPGVPKFKEWAYAGFTFAWISAFVAHYLAKDGPKAFTPLVLLAMLAVSYVTRPPSRQWLANPSGPSN